jgi:curved DNA-binding protein CbpA
VLLGLIDVWYRNFHGFTSRSVAPYHQGLKRLPAYLQQLEMESNGKRVDLDGAPLPFGTSPVVWGEPGTNGGPAGDLYVGLNVKEHSIFQRDEADVLCEVPITFVQATLGTELEVPTLEGKVKLTIPAGTQSHKTFRLKGKGIARLGAYGRGDQLVKVLVEVPHKLNSAQKAALQQFAEVSQDAHPMHRGFFEKVRTLFD